MQFKDIKIGEKFKVLGGNIVWTRKEPKMIESSNVVSDNGIDGKCVDTDDVVKIETTFADLKIGDSFRLIEPEDRDKDIWTKTGHKSHNYLPQNCTRNKDNIFGFCRDEWTVEKVETEKKRLTFGDLKVGDKFQLFGGTITWIKEQNNNATGDKGQKGKVEDTQKVIKIESADKPIMFGDIKPGGRFKYELYDNIEFIRLGLGYDAVDSTFRNEYRFQAEDKVTKVEPKVYLLFADSQLIFASLDWDKVHERFVDLTENEQGEYTYMMTSKNLE